MLQFVGEEPKPELDYRKIKKEMTLLEPVWVFHGMIEENQKEGRQVEGSCSRGGAQGSAVRRIKHRDTSQVGGNMPAMAVLRRGGERWRGGHRSPRDIRSRERAA